MANQEKNQNQNGQQQEQVQQQNAAPAQPEQVVQQQVVVEQKQGPKGWLKQHWKGAVAAITGLFAAGGSAYVAYKKGKAAGINSVPLPQTEDYSLNPNE